MATPRELPTPPPRPGVGDLVAALVDAWRYQQLEAFALVDEAAAQPLPGAVVGHGEDPRDAVRRALAATGADGSRTRPDPPVRGVHSRYRPGAGVEPAQHVLQLVFDARRAASGGSAVSVPELAERLRGPLPAPAPFPTEAVHPRVQRAAAYAVVRRAGHVLLTRVTEAGVWTLPGGGIDLGEHPDETVVREVYEETGLHLEESALVSLHSDHFVGNSLSGRREDYHGVRLLYRGHTTDPREPVVVEVGGSSDAARWVPEGELGRLRLSSTVVAALELIPE